MSESTTKPTDSDVDEYIAAIPHDRRRGEAETLVHLMREVTGAEPAMWGPTMIGFGHVHYRYESGNGGEMFRVGFAPRKASLVLYGLNDAPEGRDLLPELGPHRESVACVYVTNLAKIDEGVLRRLVEIAWTHQIDSEVR